MKLGDRKLRLSDRQLRISDSKISTKISFIFSLKSEKSNLKFTHTAHVCIPVETSHSKEVCSDTTLLCLVQPGCVDFEGKNCLPVDAFSKTIFSDGNKLFRLVAGGQLSPPTFPLLQRHYISLLSLVHTGNNKMSNLTPVWMSH